MEIPKIIPPPNKKQLLTLRIMICIGFGSMVYFLGTLFDKSIIANLTLYWLLMLTLIFTCLKIIYEWYHYLFISVPPTYPTEKTYTVDIFTTFCEGEPYDMIVETLTAVQGITYPHQTYLCDEADDPYLKEVCKKLGVNHITRTEKINAKAGNINNALKQSTGELCVVLDPDHVPFPEFLDPIVNHFNDPTIGYVQIVQAYANHHQSLVAKGAAEQTYQFYGPMMMTMNSYGTVQAIGANCTFRRTALESIGGHAAGLAEDMHTAMQLHAKGWESVYVPAILARGLVPATLSAYYKQQLKWSRGVFELLVTSYISLFSKFNWRQKLHYGILPFHYLSGIVYFLNFVIPIISLFSDTYPLLLDLGTFLFDALPFVISIVIIRHYVQQWVMEDKERGFHIVGGLLLIGTWWVFIVGIFYTIIRKKVPYIPTPKEATNEKNLIINLPNIVVLILSLTAIAYGLYYDWNPFTFMMVGIACINCISLSFVLLASEQLKIRKYRKSHPSVDYPLNAIAEVKSVFWVFRRRVYKRINNYGLIILIMGIFSCFYFKQFNPFGENIQQQMSHKKDIFLTGIFSPQSSEGLSSMALVKAFQVDAKCHVDIVSFYISWGNAKRCFIPTSTLKSVYQNNSIPMITWEPWQILFEDSLASTKAKTFNDKKVFLNITHGKYDDYIKRFALDLKALNRPVFLRFAHEVDNPFYPWSKTGNNTPLEFKAAWMYLRKAFIKNNVYNVVWVWNPWKPATVNEYFPGKENVDWIGVTGLNFAEYSDDKKSYSLEQLYRPYHQNRNFKTGIPIMIAEVGTLKKDKYQDKWLNEGIKNIKNKFPEVKALVLFNSAVDENIPDGSMGKIDWTIRNPSNVSAVIKQYHKPIDIINTDTKNHSKVENIAKIDSSKMFLNLQGVNYTKAQNWHKNITPLTKKTIIKDFGDIKQSGINTIKCYGPNVYDRITFEVAARYDLKITYGFWIPDNINFSSDKKQLVSLTNSILTFVTQNRNNTTIKAWHIGNNIFQKLDKVYYKPALFYQQQAYFNWLRSLVTKIKAIDGRRLISMDILMAKNLEEVIGMLHYYVPEIDTYGLIIPDKSPDIKLINNLKVPYFYSNIHIKAYLRLPKNNHVGGFIQNWQDYQNSNYVSFSGLRDVEDENKPELYQLAKRWHGNILQNDLPPIKILRPAMTTVPNHSLPYYALFLKDRRWQIAENNNTGMKFRWYLVKNNSLGEAISIKKLGEGTSINVIIPEDVSSYRLYLTGFSKNNITTTQSVLNLPLYSDEL